MFNGATAFDQPLWKWGTGANGIGKGSSNNISLSGMFANTTNNHHSLRSLNHAKVTDYSAFAKNNTAFNQPINDWNIKNVNDFTDMFNGATAFNQALWKWGLDTNTNGIGKGDTIIEVSLGGMFANSNFNKPIGWWDVSKVSDFRNTFKNSQYNQPLYWADTFDDAIITDLTGFLDNTSINHLSLKNYDCRFQYLNGFDKIFGESLPTGNNNISPAVKFKYGSIQSDPCSVGGPGGLPGDDDDDDLPNTVDVVFDSTEILNNIQLFGSATNYLLESTTNTYRQDFIDAIDYWNSAVSYPSWFTFDSKPISLEVSIEKPGFDGLSNPQIDGVLANAFLQGVMGPPGHNNNFGEFLPTQGQIRINESYFEDNTFAETDSSTNKSKFYYTIRHELGHILGIGSLFINDQVNNIPVESYSGSLYYYTGTHGVEQYKSYITDDAIKNNIVGLPIEDDGGPGTANAHFERGDLSSYSDNDRYINGHFHPGVGYENMSGWIYLQGIGSPISRMSLGVLKDVGWDVDMTKAEDYVMPVASYNADNAIYIILETTNKTYLTVNVEDTNDTFQVEWRSSSTDNPDVFTYGEDGDGTTWIGEGTSHYATRTGNAISVNRNWFTPHFVHLKITGNITSYNISKTNRGILLNKVNGMSSLTGLNLRGDPDLSEMNTSGITTFQSAFKYANITKDLDISTLNPTGITDFTNMFASCRTTDHIPDPYYEWRDRGQDGRPNVSAPIWRPTSIEVDNDDIYMVVDWLGNPYQEQYYAQEDTNGDGVMETVSRYRTIYPTTLPPAVSINAKYDHEKRQLGNYDGSPSYNGYYGPYGSRGKITFDHGELSNFLYHFEGRLVNLWAGVINMDINDAVTNLPQEKIYVKDSYTINVSSADTLSMSAEIKLNATLVSNPDFVISGPNFNVKDKRVFGPAPVEYGPYTVRFADGKTLTSNSLTNWEISFNDDDTDWNTTPDFSNITSPSTFKLRPTNAQVGTATPETLNVVTTDNSGHSTPITLNSVVEPVIAILDHPGGYFNKETNPLQTIDLRSPLNESQPSKLVTITGENIQNISITNVSSDWQISSSNPSVGEEVSVKYTGSTSTYGLKTGTFKISAQAKDFAELLVTEHEVTVRLAVNPRITGIEDWDLSHLVTAQHKDTCGVNKQMFASSNLSLLDLSNWDVRNYKPDDAHLWHIPSGWDHDGGTFKIEKSKQPQWEYTINKGTPSGSVPAGAVNIPTVNASDFTIGDQLVIGRGTPNEETKAIVGNGTGQVVASDANTPELSLDSPLENEHPENTTLESRPPESAFVNFEHEYGDTTIASFATMDLYSTPTDTIKTFKVNAENIVEMKINKLPILNEAYSVSRPFADLIVKINDVVAKVDDTINDNDTITIHLPDDASDYGGTYIDNLEIYATSTLGSELGSSYKDAEDGIGKLILLPCKVSVNCNTSICVSVSNGVSEGSIYEGTWEYINDPIKLTIRTGLYDDSSSVEIQNYYMLANGDESFILFETPDIQLATALVLGESKREWQLRSIPTEQLSYYYVSGTTLLGSANEVISNQVYYSNDEILKSCIGGLKQHTDSNPFYMMVGDVQLEFYEDECILPTITPTITHTQTPTFVEGPSGPSGDVSLDEVISIDSIKLTKDEQDNLTLEITNLVADTDNTPVWSSKNASSVYIWIVKDTMNQSLEDAGGWFTNFYNDISIANSEYGNLGNYNSWFNANHYEININISKTLTEYNNYFTEETSPKFMISFADWNPTTYRGDLEFPIDTSELIDDTSDDDDDDDDDTSSDTGPKYNNPFGTFSIGSFSHWSGETYDTWNGNYSADYILVDPAEDELMYYVWKNDADNSLKIAVKYNKPTDFDPSNPSFMDITNQSNFIQGVYFLNSSCSGDDCNLVESHFLSTNLDEYGHYTHIEEDQQVNYGVQQQSPSNGMLWNLLGGFLDANVIYTEAS